jgi:hypothetical protein
LIGFFNIFPAVHVFGASFAKPFLILQKVSKIYQSSIDPKKSAEFFTTNLQQNI